MEVLLIMKAKKLLILVLVFSALSVGAVFAAAPWGEYQGFSKVKVNINNTELAFADVPAFLTGGRVVLPLRQMADSLQALIRWNNSTQVVDVYKPNVHIFVAKEVTKDYVTKQPFGKVQLGDTLNFVVFAQVDNLETRVHSFKIEVLDPYGNLAAEPKVTVLEEQKESFWYPWPFTVSFDAYGKYKVRFSMKLNETDSDYTVISEKVIVSE
jgi:hypothetical protein